MSRPRLLDLFCGQGGAAMGYYRAGFEVVGVDVAPQPRYPFAFVQADALELLDPDNWSVPDDPLFDRVDAIHASPPCQAYSPQNHRWKRDHPDLIDEVRERLCAWTIPYVIENVPGAPLIDPYVLCGSSLGLQVRRHRLFETTFPLLVPPCVHGYQGQPWGVYGSSGTGQERGRKSRTAEHSRELMEMPWADQSGCAQAVPPVYTELIGLQLLAHLGEPVGERRPVLA